VWLSRVRSNVSPRAARSADEEGLLAQGESTHAYSGNSEDSCPGLIASLTAFTNLRAKDQSGEPETMVGFGERRALEAYLRGKGKTMAKQAKSGKKLVSGKKLEKKQTLSKPAGNATYN
jgi:hypothetical protein